MKKYKNSFEQVYDAFGFSPGGWDFNSTGKLYEPILFINRSMVNHLGRQADQIVLGLNNQLLVGGYSEIRIKEDV